VARNKVAITNLGEKDKRDAAFKELTNIVAIYEELLKGNMNHNMKALLFINASQSALLSDQVAKSIVFFKEYRLLDGSTAVQSAYAATLPNFYYRALMKDADPIILHESDAVLK
jgi:hypothetical protein